MTKRYSSLFHIHKPMILSYLLMKPTHTQPNSPVISIINRSISALIRSRWAKRASTNSISCCATDLISNSNRRPRSRNMSYDAEERQGREWAVGVEN